MDLNGLKQANDSLGHAAGDELLRAAADQMKESFSPYGKVYRIGGDEFVVILTKKVQELPDLLKDFDHQVFQWHGELANSMAISYGYVFSSEKNGVASTRSQKQPINGCMKTKPVITLKTDSTEENNQDKEEMPCGLPFQLLP